MKDKTRQMAETAAGVDKVLEWLLPEQLRLAKMQPGVEQSADTKVAVRQTKAAA